jgi:hypothetical protein
MEGSEQARQCTGTTHLVVESSLVVVKSSTRTPQPAAHARALPAGARTRLDLAHIDRSSPEEAATEGCAAHGPSIAPRAPPQHPTGDPPPMARSLLLIRRRPTARHRSTCLAPCTAHRPLPSPTHRRTATTRTLPPRVPLTVCPVGSGAG